MCISICIYPNRNAPKLIRHFLGQLKTCLGDSPARGATWFCEGPVYGSRPPPLVDSVGAKELLAATSPNMRSFHVPPHHTIPGPPTISHNSHRQIKYRIPFMMELQASDLIFFFIPPRSTGTQMFRLGGAMFARLRARPTSNTETKFGANLAESQIPPRTGPLGPNR